MTLSAGSRPRCRRCNRHHHLNPCSRSEAQRLQARLCLRRSWPTAFFIALAHDRNSRPAERLGYDKAALLATMQATGASTRGIRLMLRKLSTLAGGLLQALWQRAQLPADLALVAVGALGATSRFLIPTSMCCCCCLKVARPTQGASCAPSWRALLAAAGMWPEIGSSVRTVAECLAESAQDDGADLAAGGPPDLRQWGTVCTVPAAIQRATEPAGISGGQTLEMRQRHTKYENTPYALEPNCKESPGGLRDLQMILWVARAAGLGRTWKEPRQRHGHGV